jgi:hypothetical protein
MRSIGFSMIGLDDNGTKRVLRHYEATRKGSH